MLAILGWKAIHLASANNNSILSLIIKDKSLINFKNPTNNWTPLTLCMLAKDENVKLLLQNGAELNATSKLNCIFYWNKDKHLVDILLL